MTYIEGLRTGAWRLVPVEATPGMIAAAWAAWHSRHGGKLGPGPCFVEALKAAMLSASPDATAALLAEIEVLRGAVAAEAQRWRHKKRGSVVAEIGIATAQAATRPIEDMEAVRVYRHVEDGRWWVRRVDEFDDGRFEPIPARATKDRPDV